MVVFGMLVWAGVTFIIDTLEQQRGPDLGTRLGRFDVFRAYPFHAPSTGTDRPDECTSGPFTPTFKCTFADSTLVGYSPIMIPQSPTEHGHDVPRRPRADNVRTPTIA